MEYVKCSNSLDIPSEIIFQTSILTVSKCLIGYDREYASVQYFVDDNNSGTAYGVTGDREEAIKLAIAMQDLLEQSELLASLR